MSHFDLDKKFSSTLLAHESSWQQSELQAGGVFSRIPASCLILEGNQQIGIAGIEV